MSSEPTRVLVVAHKTAATPALIEAVRERAARGPAVFTLLVPPISPGIHRVTDPEDHRADEDAKAMLELACPLLSEAAGHEVRGRIGSDPAPLTSIEDAIHLEGYDEIIISTLPARVSRWLHLDLPHKLNGLGLPVTTVTAKERAEVSPA
jgi:hypothetical protein